MHIRLFPPLFLQSTIYIVKTISIYTRIQLLMYANKKYNKNKFYYVTLLENNKFLQNAAEIQI